MDGELDLYVGGVIVKFIVDFCDTVEYGLGVGEFDFGMHFVFAVVHVAGSPFGFGDLLGEVVDCEGFGEDGGSWDLVGRGLVVACKLPSFP